MLCKIHRYNYSGVECPFCVKERKEKIEELYSEEIAEYSKPSPVTEDELLKLSDKFTIITKKK